MPKVRLVQVKPVQSYYVGDVVELEDLLRKGYEIAACAALGEFLIYTLVHR